MLVFGLVARANNIVVPNDHNETIEWGEFLHFLATNI